MAEAALPQRLDGVTMNNDDAGNRPTERVGPDSWRRFDTLVAVFPARESH